MKKRLVIFCILMTMLFTSVFALNTFALDLPIIDFNPSTPTVPTVPPTLRIQAKNLSFSDSVYIMFAVAAEDIDSTDINGDGESDLQLLIWTQPQTTYEYGTHTAVLSSEGTMNVQGYSCQIFNYKEIAAKNLADNIYARAYLSIGSESYYSELNKYSVLQYAYNKMGITGSAGSDTLVSLLRAMLDYGAAAQQHFGYNTDRLANGDFYQIKTAGGGTLEDGTTEGLYQEGDTVTLIAPETNEKGEVFACWIDEITTQVALTPTATVTVGTKHMTYTPLYFAAGEDISSVTAELAALKQQTLTDHADSYDAEAMAELTALFTAAENQLASCLKLADAQAILDQLKTDIAAVPTLPALAYTLKSDGTYEVTGMGTVTGSEITVPATYHTVPVTSIGRNAFLAKTSLTSVTLSEGLTSIGGYAFGQCSALAEINLPSTLTTIDTYAFSYCTALSELTLPDGLSTIGEYAFGASGLTEITLPATLSSMGKGAFYRCDKLTAVTFEAGASSLGANAFDSCTALTSVTLSGNIRTISERAFANCDALTEITVPSGTVSVGQYAFYSCDALKSVTLADSVRIIETYAFHSCAAMTAIDLPEGLSTVGNYAFYQCSGLTEVNLPASVTQLGEGVFIHCPALASLSVDDANTVYHDAGNCIIRTADTTLVIGAGTSVIPDDGSVTAIAPKAFYGSGLIQTIVIPEGITTIGADAFYQSAGLREIALPASVTSIGLRAFGHCPLDTIRAAEDNPVYFAVGNALIERESGTLVLGCASTDIDGAEGVTVKAIGTDAFHGQTSLLTVKLPEGIESIGVRAFYGCTAMTEITVPGTVTAIGNSAFENNTALRVVHFNGTSETWAAVTIGTGNTPLLTADILFN